MDSIPNLDGLQAFAVFSEHLNFTRAARALGLSQPALHTRIKRLSETLGQILYRRQGARLVLTDAGREVARFARELDQRIRDFHGQLQGTAARRPVTLCAGEGSYLYLLGPVLRRFGRREHLLRLQVASGPDTLEAVRQGTADLGVLSMDTVPEDVEAVAIASTTSAVAMPRSHPLAAQKSLRLAELAGIPLVVPAPSRPLRRRLEIALGNALVVGVEATGWPLMLHLVSLGAGLAVVPSWCHAPRTVILCPLADLEPRDYFVIRARGYTPPEAPQALWQALCAIGVTSSNG